MIIVEKKISKQHIFFFSFTLLKKETATEIRKISITSSVGGFNLVVCILKSLYNRYTSREVSEQALLGHILPSVLCGNRKRHV